MHPGMAIAVSLEGYRFHPGWLLGMAIAASWMAINASRDGDGCIRGWRSYTTGWHRSTPGWRSMHPGMAIDASADDDRYTTGWRRSIPGWRSMHPGMVITYPGMHMAIIASRDGDRLISRWHLGMAIDAPRDLWGIKARQKLFCVHFV